MTPEALAELIALTEAKTINSKIAKDVLARLWADGGSAKASSKAKASRKSAIPARSRSSSTTCSPPTRESRRATSRPARKTSSEFLVGQVMKLEQGKANPALVEELLQEKIAAR